MRHSPEIDKLAAAVLSVQIAHPFVDKTTTADQGSYKVKYAPHDEVWEAVRHTCAEHGIAVIQGGREGAGASHWLVTLLVHTASGQWIETDVKIEQAKAGMQALGAVWSYARRIGLLAALGVVAKGEDTDAAGDHAPRGSTKPRMSPAARPTGNAEDAAKGWEDAINALPSLLTMQAIDELRDDTKARFGGVPKDMYSRVQKAFTEARGRVDAAARKAASS